MAKEDAESRLARARAKISREDAYLLRATVHGWVGIDDLTIIGPTLIARQVLAALDAVSVLHGTEAETAATDEALSKLQKELHG